jgi:hypothetical protein
MVNLTARLRAMTAAGTADFTAGTVSYFTDDVLQSILDRHCESFVFEAMEAEDPTVGAGSTYTWTVYDIEHTNIEESTGGTSIFWIQDNQLATVAAADYSVDYENGIVTFDADTAGATYYANGTSYDLNGAAADIWELKAMNVAKMVNFSTDGHRMDMGTLKKDYMDIAKDYRAKSWSGSGGGGEMTRRDTDAC